MRVLLERVDYRNVEEFEVLHVPGSDGQTVKASRCCNHGVLDIRIGPLRNQTRALPGSRSIEGQQVVLGDKGVNPSIQTLGFCWIQQTNSFDSSLELSDRDSTDKDRRRRGCGQPTHHRTVRPELCGL